MAEFNKLDGIDTSKSFIITANNPDETPDRAEQYFTESCEECNELTTAIDGVVEELLRAVELDIQGSIALLNSLTDEVIGGTDLEISQIGAPLFKLSEKIFKDTKAPLDTALNDLVRNGFTPAYDLVGFTQAMAGDWVDMVAQASPALSDAMGYTASGTAPPPPPPPLEPWPTPTPTPEPWPTPTPTPEPWPVPTPSPYPVPQPWPNPQPTPTPTPVPQPWPVPTPQPVPQPTPIPPTPPVPPGQTAVCCPAAPITVVVSPAQPQSPPTVNLWAPPAPPYPQPKPEKDCPPNTVLQPIMVPLAAPPVAPPPAPPPPPSSLLFPLASDMITSSNPLAINWGSITDCDAMAEIIKRDEGLRYSLPPPETTIPVKAYVDSVFGNGVWSMLGTGIGGGAGKFGEWINSWMVDPTLRIGATMATIDNMATTALLSTIAPRYLPNPVSALHFGTKVAAGSMAERKTGFPMTYLTQGDLYGLQYSNPQYLPNQIRTDDAFLAGQINESTWRCWTLANGNLAEPSRRVMVSHQLKPGLHELITLYRRGNLRKEDLPKRLRELGMLDPMYAAEFLEITKALPTQSDLIRFMVRDAADKAVVEKYGYDNGFDEKYTAQMKRWGEALGLDETYFRYSWRSHWDIPSFTQLTEMLFRLRPDRLEVREWEARNGKWKPDPPGKPTPGKPRVVTPDDVRQALQTNDMSPGWVDELMQVSATPINRTDAVRAYMMGAFSDEQLYDSFRSTKYSERDARLMLEFYRKDKARRQRNLSGTWSPRKVVRYYKNNLINRQTAEEYLSTVMPNAQMVRDVLDGADAEMAADRRHAALKAMKKQWFYGKWTEAELKDSFAWMQLDPAQVQHIVAMWTIERDGRSKQPTVAMIGKWVGKSIISLEEARTRLVNLGYDSLDADRILAAALQWDFEGATPSNEELSNAVEGVVKTQREARKRSDAGLARRIRQIVDELTRVKAEVDRRLENADQPKSGPIMIP